MLRENDVWAMVLDEDGRVVWEHGLPEGAASILYQR